MLNFLLLLLLNVSPLAPQDALLMVSDTMVVNNLLNLGDREGWRFHPGDNLQWADPDFDDSQWMLMKPVEMTEPIPDSVWPGYGWFRLRFSADSTIYNNPWTLYFFTWGAAEVYIDGKLIKTFGNFSSDRSAEKGYMPYQKLHPAFVLAPDSSHVVAVRFSYHEASRYKKILGSFSHNFGFGIGFSTIEFNAQTLFFKNISNRVVHISGAMLVVIILLHGFLFLLFPDEKSNKFIAIISVLLLLHSIVAFAHLFFEIDRLWYFLVRDCLFPFLFLLAVSLFPTALSLMFNQKQKRIYRILIYTAPLLAFSILMLMENSILPMGIFGVIIAVLSANVLIKAGRAGEKGVWFVATGFLGSLFSAFGIVIYEVIVPSSSWAVESIFITLVYVSIPLGMTLFMAYRFYHLYAGLESKVIERTKELKTSLDELKSTQTQLIHAEKMASLGELTAGIAHEIQNPLNFVNNFAEVSGELVEEMKEELAEGSLQYSVGSRQIGEEKLKLTEEIANDVKQNLEKINYHGKRADAIVKGMLQHSRTSIGQKELTDINALADEYLRLSYHGLRAKDKSFNAQFETDFDTDLPKIMVIPQDIGRVLLNLINNAFYTVAERQKNLTGFSHGMPLAGNLSGLDTYKPNVTVSTKSMSESIEISVKDNGAGIPEEIKNKIFQPFFTTKPTGQGTGLGLSLSYDIVKAHGGELKVDSKENEGTTFTLMLPL